MYRLRLNRGVQAYDW